MSTTNSGADHPSNPTAPTLKTMDSMYTSQDLRSFPARVTSIRLFTRPRQRQRWGDHQILPHTNWGDLFFDLFYVAAAYNLSNIILSDPTPRGILYFLALFGPIMAEWFHRMYYDSRFAFGDDPTHRLFEVLHLCMLATSIVHIRSVDVMSNPSVFPDMFGYSLGLSLLSLLNILRCLEIYFWVDEATADKDATKNVVKRDMANYGCQGTFYLAATILSGLQYYDNKSNAGGNVRRGLFSGDDDPEHDACSRMIITVSSFAADQCGFNRFLAASEEDLSYSDSSKYSQSTDTPAWLCLAGYLFNLVHMVVMVFCYPGGGRHKAYTVPMNIDFVIHRLGEWTMLLLGESILSLLIVETSLSANYFVTFYSGLVSVILLQYLHFRSQPHHADDHAMRRSKNAGMLFSTIMQLYSFALVAVGVSFKMLLYEYVYQEAKGGYRLRRLVAFLKEYARNLAGGEGSTNLPTDERQERVANFFCGSMVITFVCLDAMILTHQGVKTNAKRCQCQQTKKISKIGIFLASIRVGIIIFVATLSQYVQKPELVASIGMVSIVVQVFTRILGDLVYPKAIHVSTGDDKESDGESESERWPNVTHARAEAPINDEERGKIDEAKDGHTEDS